MATLVQSIMPDVIKRLEHGPATLRQVSDALDRNYYTVRMAVQELMADGIVTCTSLYARNAKYMLTDQAANNNSIPMIFNGQQNHKMFQLLKLRHSEDMAAATAVFNIPRHMARLFMSAKRLKDGQSQGDTIQRIQDAMRTDLGSLQAAVKIYEAVLNNPKNWHEGMLLRYTEDHTFDEHEVIEAFEHYFRTEN